MKKNGNLIAIYSRKSKFTGKGESIGNQVELCKEYVRNMFGPEYVDRCVIFEDEGFSGGDLKRPDFQKMMAEVRQRKSEAIAERIRDNMHELAKTGRWLGGNAPTGFKSEAVEKVTVDGKIRKSFKLTPIPEEAEIPKMIFDLYTETDSLTAVEAIEDLCEAIDKFMK